jgi:hypothetical protein
MAVPKTASATAGTATRPNSTPTKASPSVAPTKHTGKSGMIGIAATLVLLAGAALFYWAGRSMMKGKEVNVLALSGLTAGNESGNWTHTQQGLEVKATTRTMHLETPYEPQTDEYELNAEFSLTAPRTGYITFRFPTRHGYVPLFLQVQSGPKFMGHHMGGYDGYYVRGGAAADLLKLGLAMESLMKFAPDRTYKLKVEIGASALKVTLDGESLISWQGDVSRWKPNPSLPAFTPSKLVIGSDRGGILFHRITSLEKPPSAPRTAAPSKQTSGTPKATQSTGPTAAETTQFLKTESLGGVSFRMPEADLKKLLGEPDKWGEESKDVHNGGTLTEADYSSKGLAIVLRTDDKSGLRMVDEVYVKAPSTQHTAGGIQVGSPLEDLRRVYGAYENKAASDEQLFVAGSEREGIYFGLKEGRVFYIRLGAGYE